MKLLLNVTWSNIICEKVNTGKDFVNECLRINDLDAFNNLLISDLLYLDGVYTIKKINLG